MKELIWILDSARERMDLDPGFVLYKNGSGPWICPVKERIRILDSSYERMYPDPGFVPRKKESESINLKICVFRKSEFVKNYS